MATTPVSQSKPNPLHGTPPSDAATQSGTPKEVPVAGKPPAPNMAPPHEADRTLVSAATKAEQQAGKDALNDRVAQADAEVAAGKAALARS